MQIVEENVKHKTWGTGIIVSADDSNVSVFFDSLQKSVQFNFPYVFKTQLTFEKPLRYTPTRIRTERTSMQYKGWLIS